MDPDEQVLVVGGDLAAQGSGDDDSSTSSVATVTDGRAGSQNNTGSNDEFDDAQDGGGEGAVGAADGENVAGGTQTTSASTSATKPENKKGKKQNEHPTPAMQLANQLDELLGRGEVASDAAMVTAMDPAAGTVELQNEAGEITHLLTDIRAVCNKFASDIQKGHRGAQAGGGGGQLGDG